MMELLDFRKITKALDIKEFFAKDNEKTLLIYSKTTLIKNNIEKNNLNYEYISTSDITKSKNKIDALFNDLSKFKKIIAIGGGIAIDIGKYLASKFKSNIIVIPRMLAHNFYSIARK